MNPPNLTEFQQIMAELEAALTGRSVESVATVIQHSLPGVQAWTETGCNPVWRLSGGGGVEFNTKVGRLGMWGNRAFNCWESARLQRCAAERYIRNAIEAMDPEAQHFWEPIL